MNEQTMRLFMLGEAAIELTSENAPEFLRIAEEAGVRWNDGTLPTSYNPFANISREHACRIVHPEHQKMCWGPSAYWESEGFMVVPFEEAVEADADVVSEDALRSVLLRV